MTFGKRSPLRQLLFDSLSESRDLGGKSKASRVHIACRLPPAHAKFYTGLWTDRWKKGPRQDAFLSAMAMTISHGLRHIEGEALVEMPFKKGLFICTTHPWNADNSDVFIDVSTSNTGLAYFGVEFSVERVYEAWRNSRWGVWSVIGDAERDWPVLQRPWQGEKLRYRFPHAGELYMLRGRPFGLVRTSLGIFK